MMKKQLIIENALELFSRQGIEATSIQQITEKCGISKGAFYLSFKSKDELILSLIDMFIVETTKDIERLVTSSVSPDELLREYLLLHLGSFKKNIHYAQLFMKEHSLILKADILEHLKAYNVILNKLVYTIVSKKYSTISEYMKQDLVFLIASLTRAHAEYIICSPKEIDLDMICSSIEEKIDIIAQHAKIPFTMNFSLLKDRVDEKPFNKDSLINYFESFSFKHEDSILQESIELLTNHLKKPSLSPAIEKGLLNNLQKNVQTKHLVYLYNEIYNLP